MRCAGIILALLGSGTLGAQAADPQPPAGNLAAQMQEGRSSPRLLPPKRWMAHTALEAAIAAHPELLEPRPPGDVALVGLALRPDGSVGASALRWIPQGDPVTSRLATPEWKGLLPEEAGTPSRASWSRGANAGPGRQLGAALRLYFSRVPAKFESRRSAARVRSIVGKYNRDLLFTGDNTYSRLTVLLDADGGLLNQYVDRVARDQIAGAPTDASQIEAMAAQVARRLRIDVAQIGLLGKTAVSDGGLRYLVEYAWRRAEGERAPYVLDEPSPAPRIDAAAAKEVLDRYFPAGARGDEAGTPTVVLTAGGEVLRTGFAPLKAGGLTQAALRGPLLADLRAEDLWLQTFESTGDASRQALFIWQAGADAGFVAAQPEASTVVSQGVPVLGSRIQILRVLEGTQ
jgi:hypothetical protein